MARVVFRCEFCSRVSAAGTPARRIIVQVRPRTYPYRPGANRIVRLDPKGKPKVYYIDDPGGVGREAAREAIVCASCAARLGE
jgi:hypothetical protein